MMWSDLLFKQYNLVVSTNTLEVDVKKYREDLGILGENVDIDKGIDDSEDTQ